MKSNEAPEKIYLLHDDRYVNDLSIIWFEEPYATGSIEYTRTDAFIDKAVKWLKEQEEMVGISFQEDFLERFQNYMK